MNEAVSQRISASGGRRPNWKLFGVLLAGALVGLLAVLPYYFTLEEPPSVLPVPLWLLLILGTVQNLVLFAVAIGLGLWLGGKVGMGAPVMRDWLAGDTDAPRRFRASLPLAIGLGVAVGVIILLLEQVMFTPVLPDALAGVSPPAPWKGFLASFYGGINEELLTRLGLMTLLTWLGMKASRQEQPGARVVWIANVLAALLFGAGHLPAVAALAPLTALLVVRTLLLNGIAGVVFGWLYWKRGLLVAMTSHFSADILLHVIWAIIVIG